MKNAEKNLAVALTLLGLNLATAPAAEIRKAENCDPPELGSSWLGWVAPTANDIAVWDGYYCSFDIQTNISWGGIALRDVPDAGQAQYPIHFTIHGTGLNPFSTLSL